MAEPANDPRSRLQAFMAAMNAWDLKFHPLMTQDVSAHVDQARVEVNAIFDEYVSAAAKRTERRQSPRTSAPPEYDPDKEPIEKEEAGAKEAVFETSSQTGFRQSFRYTLVRADDRWMIAGKDVLSKAEGKWVAQSI